MNVFYRGFSEGEKEQLLILLEKMGKNAAKFIYD